MDKFMDYFVHFMLVFIGIGFIFMVIGTIKALATLTH